MTYNDLTVKHGEDGVNHILVSSAGKTAMGRMLSLGAKQDIQHPKYGWFSSILAFWVWYQVERKPDSLRNLHQESLFRTTLGIVPDDTQNRDVVLAFLRDHILSNEWLRHELKTCSIPLLIYDVYSTGSSITCHDRSDLQWYLDGIYQIKAELSTSR